MEILLTEDEQFDAATKRSPGEMHWNNICRAQLARVVEWIQKTRCEPCGGRCACGCEVLQALRKAAGEGKDA